LITLAGTLTWLKWAIITGFLIHVFYVVGTTRIMPWWRDLVSYALVVSQACWALTLLPLALNELFHFAESGRWWAVYYATSLTLTSLVTIWTLWVLWDAQRQGRRRARARLRRTRDGKQQPPSGGDAS
jgi:hypothetical protein